jgi:fumarate reductase flavoprotein subunit
VIAHETLDADVVIVGAGAAGLAAGVSLLQGGARVVACEKAAFTGGCCRRAVGPFGVGSRLQKQLDDPPRADEVFEYFMEYSHWKGDARLIRKYVDLSGPTIDWLEDLGVSFIGPVAFIPGRRKVWHVTQGVTPDAPKDMPIVDRMTERFAGLGGTLLLSTPATKIIRAGPAVTGVVAQTAAGASLEIFTRAVLVASGGFNDNVEWLEKYFGMRSGIDLFNVRIPGEVGDGLRMAWEAGAKHSEMHLQINATMPHQTLGGTGLKFLAFRNPNLLVDKDGRRFINEELTENSSFLGNAIARLRDRCAFMILDSTLKTVYETEGSDFGVEGIDKPTGLEENILQAREEGYRYVFMADSLEELATRIGVDQAALADTVNEYNRMCDHGRDALFGKQAKYLRPLLGPRFYAAEYHPGGLGTLGGIKINDRAEVLDAGERVIPGLYAAGSDANTIYGDTYPYVLPGNTMGFALNSGRIAAESILRDVLRLPA